MFPGEFGRVGFAGPDAEVEGNAVCRAVNPCCVVPHPVNGVAHRELRKGKKKS